ncbi:MAG TPA: AraC family transcriptional regulator, partial [Armatimonadota bacterium]|nr:AraC family transcriptional regulator [Armatimonadota bacterium]
ISSSIGVAFLPEPTLEGFRWAAQYAIVAQRRKVRLGLDRVFVWDTTISPAPIDLGEYWTLARRMQAVIRTGDVLETEMALEDITRALFEDRYLSLLHLRPILQVQVIFMAQAAGEVGADAESVALESEEFLHQIGTAYDYTRLRDLLRTAALFFAGKVRERFESLSNRLISSVNEYITEHINDPSLGLHSIAVHLGADPAHVSRTWKRAKGIGITKSINLKRIEQAKRLLLDRRNSISSIAFDCGFGSIQHFGRVFRQVTGTSPREYRAKNV